MIFRVLLVHRCKYVPCFINQLCLVQVVFLVRSLWFFFQFSFPSVLCNKSNLRGRERERERARAVERERERERERLLEVVITT